jgi:hypothetical protein
VRYLEKSKTEIRFQLEWHDFCFSALDTEAPITNGLVGFFGFLKNALFRFSPLSSANHIYSL